MKVIAVALFFISLAVFIIAYGVKSVYDLMDDVDDKQNTNHPKKSNNNAKND